MEDTSWPPHDQNPLIALFLNGAEWLNNREIVEALGQVNSARRNKSVVAHWGDIDAVLGAETKLLRVVHNGVETGRPLRVFSKTALLLIGMSARVPNADGFRRWVAERMMEIHHAQA
ncbi:MULTISPECIES: hypothetical protein [unclassified Sphingomonas]|jgi:prophage antirepressor-like protein|uniref:hypothetical protein n=1 Tax=unclassified Sphingomonas TaxID=196159 RepID=UPI00082BB153|nr:MULTISPECIES: hypothetical protein [unclassified Sphingomonas]